MSRRWVLAPVGFLGVSILVIASVIPMMFSIAYGLPLIVLAVSLAVLALARRHATPRAATATAARRWLTGAVAGLALIAGWLALFARPCLGEMPPVVVPAVVLLGVLTVAQLACCVGTLWSAQVTRPEWRAMASLLMWAGPSTSGFAYAMHKGGTCIGAM